MSNPQPESLPPAPERPVARDAALSLALLLAINLFNYIDRQVLSAVSPLIEKEFFPAVAATDGGELAASHAGKWLGLLSSAFLVTYMIMSPVFGMLGDRMRRWGLVGVGVILWSLASGGSGLAATFSMLLITRMFVGVGEAAYGPTAPTIIADLYPVRKRGGVLAWFYVAIPVGSALGYVLGGQIAHAWGWRWAFYSVVLPGIVLGLLCFLRREPPRGEADAPSTRKRVTMGDLGVLLQTPSYILNTVGMTAMTFAIGGLQWWVPKYVSEERRAGDLASVNTLFGVIVVVAGLTGTLLGGYLADLLRKRWSGSYFLVSGVSMLIGFPCFMAVLWMPFPAAWVAMFVAVFCLMLNTGPTNTIIANVTHPGMRASAYAVNILVIHALGDVLSPPLIGWVYDATGKLQNGFMLVGGAFIISGIVWLLGAKHLAKDTALAPTRLESPPSSRSAG